MSSRPRPCGPADPAGADDACVAVDPCADVASMPQVDTPDLGWALIVLTRSLREHASGAVADVPGGARGYLVLSTIAIGRPASQLALAQRLGVNPTVMTYLLDDLEGAGFLERRPDPADRRARQVTITPEGRAELARCRTMIRRAEDAMLAPLGPGRGDALREVLTSTATALYQQSIRSVPR